MDSFKKIIIILCILSTSAIFGSCSKTSLKDDEIYLANKSKLNVPQLIDGSQSEKNQPQSEIIQKTAPTVTSSPNTVSTPISVSNANITPESAPNISQIPKIAPTEKTTSELKGNLAVPVDLNPTVSFEDINLENLMRKMINKPSGTLTQKDVLNIYTITLDWENNRPASNKIASLRGIQSLANLNSVILRDCNISNLQPLSGLKNLKSLSLDGNKIGDLSPLSKIKALESLSLTNNQISNISALNNLNNLKRLFIKNNPIQDFSQIAPIYTNLTSKDFSLPKTSLVSPADKSIFSYTPRSLMLQWNAVAGADQYQIEVGQCLDSLSSEFANYFGNWGKEQSKSYLYTSNTTQYSFEFFGAQPGRWRVRPLYGNGAGEWSDWWYFKFSK